MERLGMAEKRQGLNKLAMILAVLLLLSVAYIIYSQVSERITAKKQDQQLQVYQSGAQFGYEQAVLQLVQQAATCRPVPVTVGNASINLIAVECLQKVQ